MFDGYKMPNFTISNIKSINNVKGIIPYRRQPLLFYDGILEWPFSYDSRNMTGRKDNTSWNALGAQRMPFMSTIDPYFLRVYDSYDGIPGLTTGWTSTTPENSLRYNEGYDISAFNFVTTREVNGLVRTLVLQGVTATDTKYIYINWFEDHRDLGNFGFVSMTGPTDNIDTVTINGVQMEQPRGLISENGTGKTNRENFAELGRTIAKLFNGGTGTDGVTFNGLRYYFPKCKFGVYSWPMWNYYFKDGQNIASVTGAELSNRMEFAANAFVNGISGSIDALDMLMPDFYCVLNSAYMNRLRCQQGINFCKRINEKLKELGKSPKLIIPFISPVFWTIGTGGPYQASVSGGITYQYIPPLTVLLNEDMNYQEIDPIVTEGGDGATIWLSASYAAVQIMGRTMDGTDEDSTPQPDWRKWPFLHPGGTTFGINQWTYKSMYRQAISAHYNYTKGVCLGVTGNRWWWNSASPNTTPSAAETHTPSEWLPLGTSLAPYGNKRAFSAGPYDPGAISNPGTITVIDEVLEDAKERMINEFVTVWRNKY